MSKQHPVETFAYLGGELAYFERATNWKRYWGSQVRRYLTGHVLEVGAGIGGTTRILAQDHASPWVCLEPDETLVEHLQQTLTRNNLTDTCTIRVGTVADLASDELFDSIIYIDVLEHIEDDRAEITRAAQHLRPDGYLLVLGPAHSFLFSEFDAQIGHFRRYNCQSLAALTPPTLEPAASFYLDSVGMFASLGNRLLMHADLPTHGQIWVWDTFMVPLSRILDPLLGRRVGKSVLQVWQRSTQEAIPHRRNT